MMKSKNPKIQKILMKGIAISLTAMLTFTPLAYATTSLDDNYLEGSIIDKLLYGTVGSIAREMEEYFSESGKKLYIKNETQLRALAECVNNGNSCEGQRIYLAKDIEVNSNEEWVPIGKEGAPFKGTFDGQNHTISGLKFTRGDKKDSELNSVGLFGHVTNAIIKNVKISNSVFNIEYNLASDITEVSTDIDVVDGDVSKTAFANLGAVVGLNSGGTVENCWTNSNVKVNGLNKVGGIVGYNYKGTIKRCINNTTVTAFRSAGGIVGNNYGDDSLEQTGTELDFSNSEVAKVLSCINNGVVYAQVGGAGGIVGSQAFGSITQACTNNGPISCATETVDVYVNGVKYTQEPQNVGGIVGWITGSNFLQNENKKYRYTAIDGCINNGKVKGYRDVGGIAGQLGGANGGYTIMRNCINYSTSVDATYPMNSRKAYWGKSVSGESIYIYTAEEGYLAGEINPNNVLYSGKSYLYNNMYYLSDKQLEALYEKNTPSRLDSLHKNLSYTDVNNSEKSTLAYGHYRYYNQDINEEVVGYVDYEETTTIIKDDTNNKKVMLLPTTIGGSIYEEKSIENFGMQYTGYDAGKQYLDFRPLKVSECESSKTLIAGTLSSPEIQIQRVNAETYLFTKSANGFAVNDAINPLSTASNDTDTTYPTVHTKVYVENALETGRYTAGKEVLIDVTTSEAIKDDYNSPEIQVSFSKSGIGLYNWTGSEDTKGYAKCIESRTKGDGTTTWKYSYIIQEGDEGDLSIAYKGGKITDLAGKTTVITEMYEAEEKISTETNSGFPSNFIRKIKISYWTKQANGSWGNQTDITNVENAIIPSDAKVDIEIFTNKKYYTAINTTMNRDTKPSLYIGDKKIGNDGNNWSSGDYIRYNIEAKDFAKLSKVSNMILKNETSILYSEDELYHNAEGIAIGSVLNIPVKPFTIDPLGVNEDIKVNDIYADTTAPTVTITGEGAVIDGITNSSNNIHYQFTWSETVIGFTQEDIKVKNGTITSFEEGTTGKVYYANIKSSIPDGQVGEMEVAIEQNSAQDLVGLSNVRNEKTITIDRKAPILIGLEAYANSDVALGDSINDVKESYKAEDTVTIVATFDENIERTTTVTVPTLSLQFSESGNAKGNVTVKEKAGNKITYTYTIAAGDTGELSVKGFTGTVIDVAGNETRVTKRALDGDTIIADSEAPTLVGITAIAPDFEYDELLTKEDEEGKLVPTGETKRYGVASKTRENNTITIITTYSEDVYKLDSNTIKLIDDTNKPTLKLRFGNSTERTATFSRIEGNQIYYTYNIQSGDNGNLGNIKIDGKIYDKAGNELSLITSSTLPTVVRYEDSITEENKVDNITADTTKSSITLGVTAVDKDDNGNTITGNDSYYRKGSIITITATTSNEYVYKNSNKNLTKFDKNNMPNISLKFGNTALKGNVTKEDVQYENNKTIFTYTYTIQDGDNGILKLSIAENSMYDIALNGNDTKTQDVSAINADTIKPTYRDNNGDIEYKNGAYTVTFNEPLYYLENNVVKSFGDLTKAPKLKFEGLDTVYEPSISGNVITYTGEQVNAKPYLASSTLCDKAGNLYAYYDQQAPMLSNIKVTNPPTGTYKAGDEITIVATFNENVRGAIPKLWLKFGNGDANGNPNINSKTKIEENKIIYTYTIMKSDNGILSLKQLAPPLSGKFTDMAGNEWDAGQAIGKTLEGNKIIADNTAPKVTITSDVATTNKDKVTYTYTWSEPVYGFTIDDIEVINGLKGTFTGKDGNTVYTLEVDTTNEGRQIVKVNADACTDVAGNSNEQRATYNQVVIDYTKPEVKAKVNGGNYVIDTDSKKSTLKETLVVNKKLSKFEYIWSSSITPPTSGWATVNVNEIQINSDIKLETQVQDTDVYYLYIKVTDLAGNIYEGRTNGFNVSGSIIELKPDIKEVTNQDITVKVQYGNGLTENRKAGIQGKTQSADSSKVIIGENGTIYAEATDIVGNKVYATLEITNIDKTAPTEPTEPDTPPVEEDTEAPRIISATYSNGKINVVATDNDIVEYITISDSNSQIPTTWTEVLKDKDSNNYQSAQIPVTSNGDYYVWAKDKSGNTSYYPTVVKVTGLGGDVEITVKDYSVIATPDQSKKYILVSPGTTVDSLKEKITVINGTKDKLKVDTLTNDGKLKTTSLVKYDQITKYTIVVKGDINCDGKVNLTDIFKTNAIRITGKESTLPKAQLLAVDLNNTERIELNDIMSINRIRINSANNR